LYRQVKSIVLSLVVCVLGGALANVVHLPLPWMLGPLLTMAACRLSGFDLRAPAFCRPTGQVIIGTALGLYFRPQIVRELAEFSPYMLGAAMFSMLTGYLSSVVLAKGAHIDRVTAFFASVPGGAAEMSVLGEHYGAKVDQVAVGQSLRIALVVIVFPTVFQYAGLSGSDVYEQAQRMVNPPGLTGLVVAGAVGGLLLRYFHVPNGFTIGALTVSIALTLAGAEWSAMPQALSNLGQLFIGCALGSRFEQDFLHRAPRFLAALCASIFLAMLISVIFGLGLAWLLDRPWPTMVLATAPGGVAEMSITAKVLRLGVPIVTAFHVVRMVMLVTLTAPMYRLARTLAARHNVRASLRKEREP
jgi:membrane AbrB-like protein